MEQKKRGAGFVSLIISLSILLIIAVPALFMLYQWSGRVEEEKRAKAEKQREELRLSQQEQAEKELWVREQESYGRKIYGDVLLADSDDEFFKALYFSGGFVRGAPITFIPFGQNWTDGTIEFYIKPEQYPSSGNQAIVLFNWNEYPNPSAGYLGSLELMEDGRIRYHCGWSWGDGVTPTLESRSPIPLDKWTNVIALWDQRGTRLYLNDTLDAQISEGCASGSNGNIYPWLAGYGGFVGAIDSFYAAPISLHPRVY